MQLGRAQSSNPSVPAALALALSSLAIGCAASGESTRPIPRLTAADRVADPTCSAAWIAALTARVVDEDGRPIAGARVSPCIRTGDGIGTCLLPIESDANGWALWEVDASLRCLERVAVRVMAPTAGHAASYQSIPMTPTDAVLALDEEIVVVRTSAPTSSDALGDPAAPHTVRFAREVELSVRPDAVGDADDFTRLGLAAFAGADAPSFMQQAGEPDLVFAFSPDADLLEPATVSLPTPGGARDGTRFDVLVLGGVYTALADGTLVEEGAMHPFTDVVAEGGRLVVRGVPRLGWLAFTRRR